MASNALYINLVLIARSPNKPGDPRTVRVLYNRAMIVPLLLFVLVIALGAVLLNALKPERVVARTVATGLIIAGVIGIVGLLVPGVQRLL